MKISWEDGYKFWCHLKKGDEEETGDVLVQIDIVTKENAEACPLGSGRNAPN